MKGAGRFRSSAGRCFAFDGMPTSVGQTDCVDIGAAYVSGIVGEWAETRILVIDTRTCNSSPFGYSIDTVRR